MADPVTATLALTSAYSQSVSLGLQAKAEEKAANLNARNLEIRAEQAKEFGDKEAAQYINKVNKLKGSQRAALAASGVVVDYGSGQDIQEETELFGALDAERIKNNAMMEAWGYKVQAENTRMQGQFNKQALKNQASTTLLTGGLKASAYSFGYNKKFKNTADDED